MSGPSEGQVYPCSRRTDTVGNAPLTAETGLAVRLAPLFGWMFGALASHLAALAEGLEHEASRIHALARGLLKTGNGFLGKKRTPA